ncbi:hypothetical protein GUITHDRAFT_146827 [Guillardia theta CCMP2712]|uniref:Uncharacterized protein n=1 Tax=Guillardia theta (strain CCMP2712) TaxID=905079 RepID=L1IFG3_GUITC|nr:hypothetical protein GUITHDRAFT_146827 [Guillardia theta CCMP2712]EKX35001.1 hypothetical protein GUITHDRAFT_146827 [Guillardia theta CCMP2712]|eukprot:XP_005821981.1 hypothetical protein GUITHDRAFT_146827 [Guillardia theta CCMP2712]
MPAIEPFDRPQVDGSGDAYKSWKTDEEEDFLFERSVRPDRAEPVTSPLVDEKLEDSPRERSKRRVQPSSFAIRLHPTKRKEEEEAVCRCPGCGANISLLNPLQARDIEVAQRQVLRAVMVEDVTPRGNSTKFRVMLDREGRRRKDEEERNARLLAEQGRLKKQIQSLGDELEEARKQIEFFQEQARRMEQNFDHVVLLSRPATANAQEEIVPFPSSSSAAAVSLRPCSGALLARREGKEGGRDSTGSFLFTPRTSDAAVLFRRHTGSQKPKTNMSSIRPASSRPGESTVKSKDVAEKLGLQSKLPRIQKRWAMWMWQSYHIEQGLSTWKECASGSIMLRRFTQTRELNEKNQEREEEEETGKEGRGAGEGEDELIYFLNITWSRVVHMIIEKYLLDHAEALKRIHKDKEEVSAEENALKAVTGRNQNKNPADPQQIANSIILEDGTKIEILTQVQQLGDKFTSFFPMIDATEAEIKREEQEKEEQDKRAKDAENSRLRSMLESLQAQATAVRAGRRW